MMTRCRPLLLAAIGFDLAFAGLRAQEMPPLFLPHRAIVDTREVTVVRWGRTALDSLWQLVLRTRASGLEHAACINGWIIRTPTGVADTIIASEVHSPLDISTQRSDSVTYRCVISPYFLGGVHTHLLPLEVQHVLLDFHNFTMSQYALIGAVVHEQELLWFSRELITAPWRYRHEAHRP